MMRTPRRWVALPVTRAYLEPLKACWRFPAPGLGVLPEPPRFLTAISSANLPGSNPIQRGRAGLLVGILRRHLLLPGGIFPRGRLAIWDSPGHPYGLILSGNWWCC